MTLFRKIFLAIFLVAGFWLLFDSYQSWSSFKQIKNLNLSFQWLILALLFTVLDNFFDYKSWRHYLDKSIDKSIDKSLDKSKINNQLKTQSNTYLIPAIFISSFASDLLPAKMGTFSRPFLLKNFLGLRLKEGTSVHFNALFSDFSAATLICIAGLFYWGYALYDIIFIIACIAFIIITLLLLLQLSSLKGILQRMIRAFFPAESLAGIDDLQTAIYRLFSKKDFLITLIIKFFSWLAMGLCLFSVIKALAYELPLMECVFMVTISSILGMLSFLPGGLIVAEASLLGFLNLLKIPMDFAIFMVFIYRLFSFWMWVLLGNLLAQFYLPKKIVPSG